MNHVKAAVGGARRARLSPTVTMVTTLLTLCLSVLQYSPPLIPPRGEVNAADAFDIGSFDEEDTKGIKVQHDRMFDSHCDGADVRSLGEAGLNLCISCI